MSYAEIFKKLQELPQSAQGKLYLALFALISGIIALGFWASKPDQTPIYTNLTAKDAGEVYQALQQGGFEPKLSNTGTITVPSNKLYQARYQLATQGLPKDNESPLLSAPPNFGTSSAQEAAYRQAVLEKEIAKSILSVQGIRSARVHIAQPKTNVFGKEQTPPSASVILDSTQITPSQAQAIRHLVASAIPGLLHENTAIISSKGTSFSYADTKQESNKNSTPEQLAILANMRQEYQERINRLLFPLVGSSGVRAEIDIDAAFEDQKTQTETFKPNIGESAVRSQKIDEQQGNPPNNGGVPGSQSNLPPLSLPPLPSGITAPTTTTPLPAFNSATPNTRKESMTNYELDRAVTHSTKNGITIKKVKAAVLINYKAGTNKDGSPTTVPFSAEEIQQINELIRQAIGFDANRGDAVQVSSFPFTVTEQAPAEPTVAFWENPYILENLSPLLKWIVFFIGMSIGFILIRRVIKDVIAQLPKPVNSQSEDSSPIDTNAQTADNVIIVPPTVSPEQAKTIAAQNPAAVATVIKEWMQEEKSE